MRHGGGEGGHNDCAHFRQVRKPSAAHEAGALSTRVKAHGKQWPTPIAATKKKKWPRHVRKPPPTCPDAGMGSSSERSRLLKCKSTSGRDDALAHHAARPTPRRRRPPNLYEDSNTQNIGESPRRGINVHGSFNTERVGGREHGMDCPPSRPSCRPSHLLTPILHFFPAYSGCKHGSLI
jgi:hypothetical protein